MENTPKVNIEYTENGQLKMGNFYKKYLLKTLFFHAEVMEHTTKNGPRKRRSLSGPTFFVLDSRGLQKI